MIDLGKISGQNARVGDTSPPKISQPPKGSLAFLHFHAHIARRTMTKTTKPKKQSVREYMESRTHEPEDPPPTPEEIRRQLGWRMIPENGSSPEVPDQQ